MTEPQETRPQVSNRIENNYGVAIQGRDIGAVHIYRQDNLWEKRHAAYREFASVWAQFQSHMRSCERILAQPPDSAEMRAVVDRHAELIDTCHSVMDGIAYVDPDITPAKEALQAAIEAMRVVNDRLRLKVSILEGEHFTGRILQEQQEKLDDAKKIASEKHWEFVTYSSSMLGINRESGATR